MQRRNLKPLSLLAVATAFAFALAGCASEPADQAPEVDEVVPVETAETPDPEATNEEPAATSGGGEGEAELTYGDIEFVIELQSCMLSAEDALFHGPALDAAGNGVGYFDGDFTGLADVPYGVARIDLGATQNLQSTDEFVMIGSSAGNFVVSDLSESSMIIVGPVANENGESLGSGVLKVTC